MATGGIVAPPGRSLGAVRGAQDPDAVPPPLRESQAAAPPPAPSLGAPRWLRALVGAALVAALVVYACVEPAEGTWFPRCVFHDHTGLWCPGCGGQRALHALLELRVVDALRSNAFTVAMLPLLAIHVANWLCGRGFRGPLNAIARRPRVVWTLTIALVVFAVVRNLPFAAGWLAPA